MFFFTGESRHTGSLFLLDFNYMSEEQIISVYLVPEAVEGDPYIRIPVTADKDPITNRLDRETGEVISLWEEKIRYPYKTKVSYIVYVVTTHALYAFPLKMDKDGTYFYNGSNIPSIFWGVLGLSQDSPEGIIASLVHDNILQYKPDFYKIAKESNKSMYSWKFLRLTTNIYKQLLMERGVSKFKADLMGLFINLYQALFNRKAWKELDNE